MPDYIEADEPIVSISSIGEALIALEAEIKALNEDAARMHLRMAHITNKQRLCTDAIKKILKKAVGAEIPICVKRAFPELNHYG